MSGTFIIKSKTAGITSDEFRLAAGIFSAVQRAKMIGFAQGKTLLIEIQKFANIREFTTETTAFTITATILSNRKNAGQSSDKFS